MKLQWLARIFFFGLVLCLLMAKMSSQPVLAAGIVVNTSDDTISSDGKCSLREAINNANSDSDTTGGDCQAGAGTDAITFENDYTITLINNQLPSITSAITIIGTWTKATIIQAHANPNTATWRVFNVEPTGDLTLTNLTIQNGRAEYGGGIFNNQGVVTFNESMIKNNTANANGGGIFSDYGTVSINNSIFLNNSSGTIFNGGGIYCSYATLTISGSTFSNNSGYDGAGVFNFGSGSVTVTNSTFSVNTAVNRGGGIMNFSDGSLILNQSTFSGNSAGSSGGGIFNNTSGHLYYSNTIIANSIGGDCANSGSINTNTGNIVEDGTCSPDFDGDPLLEPLDYNGGPTPTHALNGESHAIDWGNISACTATDQRGVTRPQGSDCDIGAYEVDFTSPIVTAFIVPSPAFILNIPITSFEGFDNNSLIGGYMVTTSPTAPDANDPGWLNTRLPYFSVATDGTYTLYPWVKDTDGNISAVFGSPRTVVVDTSAMPSDVIIVNTDADNIISGDEFCTLREAINNALSDSDMSGGDCAAGSGDDTITFAGYYMIEPSHSFPYISSTVTIVGFGTENTFIQADSPSNYCNPFHIEITGNLRLENLAIRNFKNTTRGVISNDQGVLSIINCNLFGNVSSYYGGAIFNTDGNVTITNSSISENEAVRGGGIYNTELGSLSITNTIILNNSTNELFNNSGGGIYNLGDLTISSSTLSDNSTNDKGGGIYTENGTLSINNTTISENSSKYGGGIYRYDTNTSINGCSFMNNSADDGGGIFVLESNHDEPFIISGSSFINNLGAVTGGGIYSAFNSHISVINSTFASNITGGNGGGIYNNGTLYLINNTINENIAFDSGGGIFNDENGNFYYTNTIIANSNGGDCTNTGLLGTNIENLVEDGSCNATYSGDPTLGPLSDNGGPTLTHALLLGSSAIDKGDQASCPATDQRGVIRPQGIGCDIGAFELEQNVIFLSLIIK